jgi:hypothetical protein
MTMRRREFIAGLAGAAAAFPRTAGAQQPTTPVIGLLSAEREAGRNTEVMWLLRRLIPDHKTIADFRKDNGPAIRQVCARFVALCREMGKRDGSDRSQLANIASQAKDVLGTDHLDVVSDRGYCNSPEILACEQADITVTLPKPIPRARSPMAASESRTSSIWHQRMSTAARPVRSSPIATPARRTARCCVAIGRWHDGEENGVAGFWLERRLDVRLMQNTLDGEERRRAPGQAQNGPTRR